MDKLDAYSVYIYMCVYIYTHIDVVVQKVISKAIISIIFWWNKSFEQAGGKNVMPFFITLIIKKIIVKKYWSSQSL